MAGREGIANEASSLAALYRGVSSYPEPARTELQAPKAVLDGTDLRPSSLAHQEQVP